MAADEPWWVNDPTIQAIRRQVLDEFEQFPTGSPAPVGPDPVLAEVVSGACWRELAGAREDRDRANRRYADAVRAARVAGFSSAEIGRVLGVSKQGLHRRYGGLD